MSHREMKMRKFSIPGQSNEADWSTLGDAIASLDSQAALGQVAVLGLPAVLVLNNGTVATFFSDDGGFPDGSNRNVIHTGLAPWQHARMRRRLPRRLFSEFRDGYPDIRPRHGHHRCGHRTRSRGPWRAVMVNVVLDEASHAQFARNWKGERNRFCRASLDSGGKTK